MARTLIGYHEQQPEDIVIYSVAGCSILGMKQLLTTHLYYGDYVKLLQGSLCRPIWGEHYYKSIVNLKDFPLNRVLFGAQCPINDPCVV